MFSSDLFGRSLVYFLSGFALGSAGIGSSLLALYQGFSFDGICLAIRQHYSLLLPSGIVFGTDFSPFVLFRILEGQILRSRPLALVFQIKRLLLSAGFTLFLLRVRGLRQANEHSFV